MQPITIQRFAGSAGTLACMSEADVCCKMTLKKAPSIVEGFWTHSATMHAGVPAIWNGAVRHKNLDLRVGAALLSF